ncbi:hypothetical protein CDD83_2428 [Cordyceps sp. RAO-2017]|nr:hypothetical protein CDD83_2428 [Cordyceps sp. RAO-2017]
MACVSNTGRKAGIQCFRVPECEGLEPLDGLLPLNGVNQTTPPTAPGSVSDVVFNPSQTALFVSIKGKGTDRGYLYAYSVDEATHRLNPNPTISRPPGLMIDFSLTFLSDSTAVVTDPAYGASYLSITPDLKVSVSKKITIPGQRATCWSVSSEEFNAVYVLDGASPNVTALDPMSGEISFVIPGNMTSMGSLDAAAAGSRLYVLQASPAVAVFDLAKPGLVQYLNLASLGPRPGWTGMAVYSA